MQDDNPVTPPNAQPATLMDAPVGARLRVMACEQHSPYIDQLQRLGLVAGTELRVVRRAPLGDPIEIRLRGYSLALRPSEASALTLQYLK